MATGENVLWIVERRMVAARDDSPWVGVTRKLFRTRKAARDYSRTMNDKAQRSKGKRKFSYSMPQRCTWGPDN